MPCELTLDRTSRIPLYRQMLDQIRSAIYAGALAPGERLPSVRQIAGRLVVNPLTVARTLNELEAAGLVECRWGKGSFVRRLPESRREKARSTALLSAAQALAARAAQLGFGLEDAIAALRAVPAQEEHSDA